ncbi:PREDICTED: ABC transporter B family member 13-like isoform X2 [Populus euphratica]|nr:PREDICTED: ABC transporter B family member 13-like isoform X2 [Populus euphratica]
MAVAGGAYTIIMSTLSEKGEAAYAEAGKVADEAISQIRTVYSFVGEEKVLEEYSKSLKKALKLGKKSGIAKGVGIGSIHGLLFCAWSMLLWYSSILVRRGDTNGAKAFTVIMNVIFSGFALGQAAPNIGAISKGRAAAASIMSMIEKDSSPSKNLEDGIVMPKVSGQIEFCEVCFSYPSRSNMVFENLSFSISAGKTFAVVGPSGSGKSTVISMVQRFYEPTSGKILLDGHDLKTLQLKWLREQMGLVSQEPALFATTIADNILFGKEDASMDQIYEAAKAANVHSFVLQCPDGYHTQVGEGGTQLSGGQKQRLAIARAVLRNPKILLLDEATSALDAESELTVQQALEKIMANRTTIVVAHRLSTIRDVDTIIVLKNGQVVESGSHLELISKGGEYASMASLQVSEHVTDASSIQSGTAGKSSFQELTSSQNQEGTTRELKSDDEILSPANFSPTPSIWELVKLNASEWPYAVLGSAGAMMAGMEAPLFALGITHMLTAFYSPDISQMKKEVHLVALIFVGAAVVTVPIYILQHYFYTLMGERLIARVRLSMFSAILCNEIGWFDLDENSTGSLTSTLAADATLVRSTLADRLSTMVQNVSLTVTAFVIGFSLSWRVSAVIIACFPLLIGAAITEQLFLKGFGGDYRSYTRANAVAREAIANIRTVASFGAEERIAHQFASELNKPNKQVLLQGHISGIGYGASQFFSLCAYALGIWYASVVISHNESDFNHVMKSFMVLVMTSFAIAETVALSPDIMKGSQALESVFSILHRKTAMDPDDPTSKVITDIKGDVELRHVSFKYPARPDTIIFEDLNLEVSAGKSLAVVGQSGSGKSTVIALILRFYDPISGTVLIDGYDVKTLNLKSLRRKIGLVQQEPALFSTTIYENIQYGNENASEIEVMKAAKAANAHGFISRMNEGYQTHVGDRGLQLSGGQKQRIAIARAILKDPSILLLDEATSALDTASEKLVQEALDKLMEGRTTVLVAHRLSTVRDADSIAVLQHGRVVEIGSHNQLIGKPCGVYKQLVSLQQGKSFSLQ